MSFSSRDIIRSFPELSGLSDEESARLKHSLPKSSWRLKWIPGVAGFSTWWAWMLIFGKGTDVLEDYLRWDLGEWVMRSGWLGILAMLALGYGTATILAFGVGMPLWRRLLKRAITTLLEIKSCFWCGSCLTGLEATDGRVRCPECGDHSPVRM